MEHLWPTKILILHQKFEAKYSRSNLQTIGGILLDIELRSKKSSNEICDNFADGIEKEIVEVIEIPDEEDEIDEDESESDEEDSNSDVE